MPKRALASRPRDPKTGRFVKILARAPKKKQRKRKPARDPKTGRFVKASSRKASHRPRDPKTGRFVKLKNLHPEYRMTAEQAIDLYGYDPFELPDWVELGMKSGWLPAVTPQLKRLAQ